MTELGRGDGVDAGAAGNRGATAPPLAAGLLEAACCCCCCTCGRAPSMAPPPPRASHAVTTRRSRAARRLIEGCAAAPTRRFARAPPRALSRLCRSCLLVICQDCQPAPLSVTGACNSASGREEMLRAASSTLAARGRAAAAVAAAAAAASRGMATAVLPDLPYGTQAPQTGAHAPPPSPTLASPVHTWHALGAHPWPAPPAQLSGAGRPPAAGVR